MNTGDKPTVWQIASGSADRNYADVFLKYNVALIGPGDAGKWSPDRDDDEFGGRFVRIFASEPKMGDVFLLRTGMSKIRAIGIVGSEYLYLDQFDDVNGWDLQHARRVRWLEFPQEHGWAEHVFGANPSRFARTWNPKVIEFSHGFLTSEPSDWREKPLAELPQPLPSLIDVPKELADVVAEVLDLLPHYWNPEEFGVLLSEDELLAHLVVPFLKALGWPSERIGVKWHDIDAVLFRNLPRTPENVRFVVEVKRLGAGIEGALEQAKGYMATLSVQRDIVMTDGIRYRLYQGQSDYRTWLYANLANLKEPARSLFDALRFQGG